MCARVHARGCVRACVLRGGGRYQNVTPSVFTQRRFGIHDKTGFSARTAVVALLLSALPYIPQAVQDALLVIVQLTL